MTSFSPPSPEQMPKRRKPKVQSKPPGIVKNVFALTPGAPRRGWPDANAWPDTGILLLLGTADDLPERFVRHYRGRAFVPGIIQNELRGHSQDRFTRKGAAASRVVSDLFLGDGKLPKPEPTLEDLPLIDQIRNALKNLPGGQGKKHGGEATVIALAINRRKFKSKPQVFLSNDSGASIVANHYQIPTRHAADVLAEFACEDAGLSATRCLELFRKSCEVSGLVAECHPADETAFECVRTGTTCTPCDAAKIVPLPAIDPQG